MSMFTAIAAEQVMALGDRRNREIVRGEVRDRGQSLRTKAQSKASSQIASMLGNWRAAASGYGEALAGGCAFRLRRDPETSVGIDVAYIDRKTPDNVFVIDGPSTLAVEIMPPSDTQADIHEKISLYLEAGTKLVWYVEPVLRKVFVYRPEAPDEVLAEGDEISGEPVLPGFRAKVDEFFE